MASKLGTAYSAQFVQRSTSVYARARIRSTPTLCGQKLDGTFSRGFFRPNPAKPFPGKTINVPQQQQARRDASVEAEASGAQQRQRPVELIDDHALPSPQEQQVKHGLIGDDIVFQTFADKHVFKAAGTKDCHKQ